ncbi:MAG: hypothetical protein P8Y75_12635 [Nitrospirota bacterium]
MKKIALILALALALGAAAFSLPGHARAEEPEGTVTPYGDFCPQCSLYGAHRGPVHPHQAVMALKAYFHTKGCSIANIRTGGRFLLVDVVRDGKVIDQIIFDRMTGRIRSIY